jgi:ion channel POLLUX/CASTOR
MNKPRFSERLRYRFDNLLSRGTPSLIAGLGVVSALIILLAAAVIVVTGARPEDSEQLSFAEAAWQALMRTLDSGTVGGDTGWTFRLVMFLVTLAGIFVISALIGVLTSGLESKLESLRKGRSRVVESGHTVILGWSSQIFTVVAELVRASANRKGGCIAILADRDKVEMEDELRDKTGPNGSMRLVCRSGSPTDMGDLAVVSLDAARSIIVLASPVESPDAQTIKTILAITNNPARRKEPYSIVAEIRDPRNMDVARIVGGQEAQLVLVGDLIARIVAQTSLQSGLSAVYGELLDFEGSEIYFKKEPALAGRTYGDALLAFEDSALIGLYQEGQVRLAPPMDTPIGPADEIIAISEDDDTIRLSEVSARSVAAQAIVRVARPAEAPSRILVLGWNWRAPTIVAQLDAYTAAGSRVTVVAAVDGLAADAERRCGRLQKVTLECREEDTTDRRVLEGLALEQFRSIIVLCYSDTLAPQEADARTLITLLSLRDIMQKRGLDFAIVSEMLDVKNRELATATRADDFVVSDQLVSLMLAQVSENARLNAVFADLFDPEGAEIYLRPAAQYVRTGVEVTFATVVESARLRGETAIGYRSMALAGDPGRAYGVMTNPPKSGLVTFGPDDRVIVLAEE